MIRERLDLRFDRGRLTSLAAQLATLSSGLAFIFALSACSSDSDGCTKDTDCASGRVCRLDGRCVAADAPPPTGGDGGASTPPPSTDCDAYLQPYIPKCGDPCRCGTHQILSPSTGCYCGYSCVTDDECARAAWASGARKLETKCWRATKYEPSWCGFYALGYGFLPIHP